MSIKEYITGSFFFTFGGFSDPNLIMKLSTLSQMPKKLMKLNPQPQTFGKALGKSNVSSRFRELEICFETFSRFSAFRLERIHN